MSESRQLPPFQQSDNMLYGVGIFHLSLQLARQVEEEMCLLQGRKEICCARDMPVLPMRQGLAQRLEQAVPGRKGSLGRGGKWLISNAAQMPEVMVSCNYRGTEEPF